jgi:hypothetical protein
MRNLFCFALMATLAFPAFAQRQSGYYVMGGSEIHNRFSWEYDADVQHIFDNRYFVASDDAFIPSGTMNTLVLAPTAGFSVQQSRQVHHRIVAGAELAYDLGSQTWKGLFREPILFYDAHVQLKRGVFEGVAGIFPRRFLEGAYSDAFFSGMYRNTDRQVEGVLLKWRSKRLYAELAGDQISQLDAVDRLQFQWITAGSWEAASWLSLGWMGTAYFFGEKTTDGKVYGRFLQNHLVEPWLKVDFARRTQWQELSLQAGLLAGYQKKAGPAELPLGGEFRVSARRWNIGVTNVTYVGGDQMPYFKDRSGDGAIYATRLYFGTPCYSGFYDYTEVAWTPRINHYLFLRIAAKFHFRESGFLGWQQQFSLRFSLDALRHRDTPMGRCL